MCFMESSRKGKNLTSPNSVSLAINPQKKEERSEISLSWTYTANGLVLHSGRRGQPANPAICPVGNIFGRGSRIRKRF